MFDVRISCFNFKGGTAKSTTVLNLGACLAAQGLSVLAIDLDGQRTLSFGLGVDGVEPTALDWLQGGDVEPRATSTQNLSVLPGSINMFRLQAEQDLFKPALKRLGNSTTIMMDCPPGLGIASVQAILNSDRVLVPTLCEPAALKGLSEAVSLIRSENPDIAIDVLRVRYRPRLVLTREADDLLIEAAEDYNYRLLHTVIPENINVAESIAQQLPISTYSPKSAGAAAYNSLAKEVMKIWGLK